jgi:hypothetical protein
MPIIALPDGHNAEFPDDMPIDQIKSVIQKKYPPSGSIAFDHPEQQSGLQQAGNFAEQNINQPIRRGLQFANDASAGFEQGLANILPGAANLGVWGANKLPGVNIPKVPEFDFAPHNVASTLGDVASFFTPGSILKEAGKIPELANSANAAMKIPLIAHGFNAAKDIITKNPMLSKVVGNAALGGSYSPDNPLLGMGMGVASPLLGKALPVIAKHIGQIPETLRNAFHDITPRKVATTIQNAYDSLKSKAENAFQKVSKGVYERGIDKVPVNSISNLKLQKYFPKTDEAKELIRKAKEGDYNALRDMQSDLFHEAQASKNAELSTERYKGKEMMSIRDKINDAISNHLKSTGNHDLDAILSGGRNDYRNMSETYHSHPTISKLVGEDREVPSNLGKLISKDSSRMERLRQATPDISRDIELLQNKQNALKKLKYLGGVSALGGVGSFLGAPYVYHKAENALSY